MLFWQRAADVEVGAPVVRDVGGVVGEEVPAPVLQQRQEASVAEGDAVAPAGSHGGRGNHPLAAEVIGVLVGLFAETSP